MPAAAVASRTPAIAGISGTSVGASGETASDMRGALIDKETVMAGSIPASYVSVPVNEGHKTCVPGTKAGHYVRILKTIYEVDLLLRRRHLRILGGIRLGVSLGRRLFRLVQALDLGGFAELADIVGLRLARYIGFDLALHLLEVRGLALALLLDLDDVPAELRLDRVGDLAGLEREGRGREFRHHLVLGEEAEIAAVGRAGILGLLLGEFGEIGALLQFFRDRLGLILGLHQDMPGMNFLLAGDLLGGLLIDLLHRLVVGRRLAFAREQAVHQEAVAGEGQALH